LRLARRPPLQQGSQLLVRAGVRAPAWPRPHPSPPPPHPAAITLHNTLLVHLLRLPKSFFDTNPAGRILNRFSRDTDIMDSTLPTGETSAQLCCASPRIPGALPGALASCLQRTAGQEALHAAARPSAHHRAAALPAAPAPQA
jgi:hypothetical protein